MHDIYISPSQIDETWEYMKKRNPEITREAAAEFAKLAAEVTARQEAKIHRMVDLLAQMKAHVSVEWMLDVIEAAGVNLEQFNEVIDQRLAAKGVRQ
jgi:hypothetical protein